MCQALLLNFLHWYPTSLSFNPTMHSSECAIPWRYMAYVLSFVCGVINGWRKWGRRDGLRDVWEVSALRYVPEKQHIFLIEVFYSHPILGEVQKNTRSPFLDKHFCSFSSAKWPSFISWCFLWVCVWERVCLCVKKGRSRAGFHENWMCE